MKDLYTFDLDEESASKTYEDVQAAYNAAFKTLGVRFVKAAASSGSMGGSLSHEYHYLSPVGEDTVYLCRHCNHAANKEISSEEGRCPKCERSGVSTERAIEVGHTFFLGTRYTEPLAATVADKNDKQVTLQMGCYGIGISRLVGAIASIFATPGGLRWPVQIAPFKIALLATEETQEAAERFWSDIKGEKIHLSDKAPIKFNRDIIIDDRDKSIGWKLNDASLIGYPIVLIFGGKYKKEQCVDVAYNLPTNNPERHPASSRARLHASQILGHLSKALTGDEFQASAKYIDEESKRLRAEWEHTRSSKKNEDSEESPHV